MDQMKPPETEVPRHVRNLVTYWLNRLKEHEAALHGVQLARGKGYILALELKDRESRIREGFEKIDEFLGLARENGVDGEAFIQSCGGVPDFVKYGYVGKPASSEPEATSASSVAGPQPASVDASEVRS